MNTCLMSTSFVNEPQDLSLDARGNKYGVSITRGGFKYDGTDFEGTKFDCACSGVFDTYEEAFEFYVWCLKEFGRGDYSWESRKEIVMNGKSAK